VVSRLHPHGAECLVYLPHGVAYAENCKTIEDFNAFKKFCNRMKKDLDGIFAALPGRQWGSGIYEHETHPSALIMRYVGGRTMN
jgi:hypothetical protein